MSKKKVHKYVIETEINFWSITEEEMTDMEITSAMREAKDRVKYGLDRGNRAGEFEDRHGKYEGNWTYRINPKFE